MADTKVEMILSFSGDAEVIKGPGNFSAIDAKEQKQ